MPPKLLSVEQANQLLPQMKGILLQLRGREEQIRMLEQKKAVEELCWLREDGTVSPQAQQNIIHLDEQLMKEARLFEKGLEELSALGAQLKSMEEGLVDFCAARGEELVYLCWKEGELQIRYWHDAESGFSGRHPLSEL